METHGWMTKKLCIKLIKCPIINETKGADPTFMESKILTKWN